MRLLIVECGNSKLPIAITTKASSLRPKPEMISTMNVNVEKLNVPEFKNMLNHLYPDVVIINPPEAPTTNSAWAQLLIDIARHVEVVTGRVLFVSSVEVLGDTHKRTEDGVEMPYSDLGTFLFASEGALSKRTSRCYIIRFPYTEESAQVKQWIHWADPNQIGWAPSASDDVTFNLVTLEDMATVIVNRIQSGWYGKFHAAPVDTLLLSKLLTHAEFPGTSKVPNRTLISKSAWNMTSSELIWEGLLSKEYEG